MTIDANSRLGDAIKRIAAGMAEHGRDRVRMTVVIGRIEAEFDVRLVRVRARRCRKLTGDKHGNAGKD